MNISYSITLTVFPALNGDSLLISYGANKKKHILVDCGYVTTYKSYIKKRIG